MNVTMALIAKRYQVLLGILAGVTTESSVVYFKVGHRPARLASPSIAFKYPIPKLRIQSRKETRWRAFWKK
jgi:hypothetical protein